MEIKVVIDGVEPQKEYTLVSQEPISFVDVMEQLGLNFYRPCGGAVKCMSCAIRFVYGAPEMTSFDERALDFSEMRNGWRLGCKCLVTRDCKIQVPSKLVGEITGVVSPDVDESIPIESREDIAIAVDIGTTTIATAVVEISTGKILRQRNCTNSQLKFGSDVMSRVKAAMEGHGVELKNCVINDLVAVGQEVLGYNFLTHRIVFSANTVMTHLFLGYTVDGMAAYPFVPYTLDAVKFVEKRRNIFFMPGISAFVGGDIVSGLYYLRVQAEKRGETQDKFLLVDLGTNAEIVLFDGEKYWCSSASAGPALEGAGLSCGVAAVRGAINHVSINNEKCSYTTLGGAPPVGLCGSGVIDVVHELHRNALIDDGGLLVEKYSTTGYPLSSNVRITGEDIQQVLLAKSAIYSAIKVIMLRSGVEAKDIKHLYVSGGLGATVSVWASAGIGLFPDGLISRFEAVGNTSLRGAIEYIKNSDEAVLEDIRNNSQVVILNEAPEFEKLFLDNLRI